MRKGFVIGKVNAKNGNVELADVVPLFHTTVFGPMLEVSTMLVCNLTSPLSNNENRVTAVVGEGILQIGPNAGWDRDRGVLCRNGTEQLRRHASISEAHCEHDPRRMQRGVPASYGQPSVGG